MAAATSRPAGDPADHPQIHRHQHHWGADCSHTCTPLITLQHAQANPRSFVLYPMIDPTVSEIKQLHAGTRLYCLFGIHPGPYAPRGRSHSHHSRLSTQEQRSPYTALSAGRCGICQDVRAPGLRRPISHGAERRWSRHCSFLGHSRASKLAGVLTAARTHVGFLESRATRGECAIANLAAQCIPSVGVRGTLKTKHISQTRTTVVSP